jgi:hypothetical protein
VLVRLGRRLLLPAACVAIVVALGSGGAAATSSAKITFSTPTVADPIHTWGEPSIGIDSHGRVFVSGPTGTGTQRSMWEGSVDGGRSFRVITPNAPPTALQGTEDPPGGGDTDINFARNGKQFFVDLYALTCDRAATTANGGASVQSNSNACGTNPGSDRPWLAVYDPKPGTAHRSAYKGKTPLVYLEYNNLNGPGPNSGAQWNKSTDGLQYTNATKGVTVLTEAQYSPFGADGYPAIDQVTGKVFQAAGFPEKKGKKYDLLLNIGTPGKSGDLTFLDKPSVKSAGKPNFKKLIRIATGLRASPDTLFTVLSMDSARNLYAVWALDTGKPSGRQVYVSAASAASGWRNWTKPVRVSNGSEATGDAVNVFPWIKAGGAGRADAVWYGSNKRVDPSAQKHQRWNVFMSQLVFPVGAGGAITGAAPSRTLVKVTPHPMHYNDICLQGSGCVSSQGNRNLADFFTVTIDRSGAAEIVYDDTSNGLIQKGGGPGGNQSADHAGAGVVTIARQSSGLGLFGKPVSGTAHTPRHTLRDRAGDARYPVIRGKNVKGMDIRSSSVRLSHHGRTLIVRTKVANLRKPAATLGAIPGANFLQYVTRWQLGKRIYYAAASFDSSGKPSFYAGKAQSVDLCSVSACFPHVITYPEAGLGGKTEKGRLSCPKSKKGACTITIKVNAKDVGKPTARKLLAEIGVYAFATSHPQGTTTNGQAQADNVPLEIDGACCYNAR